MPASLEGIYQEIGRVGGVLSQLVQEVRQNDKKTDSLGVQVAGLAQRVSDLTERFNVHLTSHGVAQQANQVRKWSRTDLVVTVLAMLGASVLGALIGVWASHVL